MVATKTPIKELNSSTVPYASNRADDFPILSPPTKEVVPASPPPVYSLLFSICNILWLFPFLTFDASVCCNKDRNFYYFCL